MGSRSASSFSVDTFVQTPIRSVVLHDVAIQLPIAEFFAGFILFCHDLPDGRHVGIALNGCGVGASWTLLGDHWDMF